MLTCNGSKAGVEHVQTMRAIGNDRTCTVSIHGIYSGLPAKLWHARCRWFAALGCAEEVTQCEHLLDEMLVQLELHLELQVGRQSVDRGNRVHVDAISDRPLEVHVVDQLWTKRGVKAALKAWQEVAMRRLKPRTCAQ